MIVLKTEIKCEKLNEKTTDKIWPKKDKDINFIIRKAVLSGATAGIKVSSITDPAKIDFSEMMFSNFGNEKGYQHYKDILKNGERIFIMGWLIQFKGFRV